MNDKTVDAIEIVLVIAMLIVSVVIARTPVSDKRESLTLENLTTYSTSVTIFANQAGDKVSFCALPDMLYIGK